ncbi:hypothetical protein JCM11641_007082 [Rhodosporidiobolus odoratus]
MEVESPERPFGRYGGNHTSTMPVPRLPSISSLLNAVTPLPYPSDVPNGSPTRTTLPPVGALEHPPRGGSFPASISPSSLSPISFSRTTSGSSGVSTAGTGSSGFTAEAVPGESHRHSPQEALSPRSHRLPSVDYSDGNALRPLPSGLSPNPVPPARQDFVSLGDRPRSISASCPRGLDYPSFLRSTQPYNGFQMSSERGGEFERARYRASLDGRDPRSSQFFYTGLATSHNRPRALSTSTAEDYRSHSAWPGTTGSPADLPYPAPNVAASMPGASSSPRRGSATAPRLAHVMEQPHLPTALPQQPPNWAFPNYPPLPQKYDPGGADVLPTPPPIHHNPGHALNPLTIPSGLPHPGSVSPHSASPHGAPPPGHGLFPSLQPRPGTSPIGHHQIPSQQAGWGAPPNGAFGRPLSAQGSADLAAYGMEGVIDLAGDGGRYTCPHCSKRFARPSSLRIHMHSHTGEKPFSCPLCDRAFSVQSNLRRHLKIHKGGASQVGPSRRGGGSVKLAAEQQARAAGATQGGGVMEEEGGHLPAVYEPGDGGEDEDEGEASG